METSAFLVFLKTLIPGMFGALIAMWRTQKKTLAFKAIAFFVAVWIAHFVGNGVIKIFTIVTAEVQDLIKVGLGLFGMRLIEAIELQIPATVRAFRAKIIGRDPESQRGEL